MAGDPNSVPIAEYPANNHIPCDYALPVAPELWYGAIHCEWRALAS
jgi:hypothetical protein